MAALPNAVDRYVGTCLKERRSHLALSQADVATVLATSVAEVGLLETGAKRVSAERIRLLAGLLEVAPSFVYQGLLASSR